MQTAESTQLNVAIEHELQSGLIRVSDFLLDKSDSLARLQRDFAAVRQNFAANQSKKRGFSAAIFSYQPNTLAGVSLKIYLLQ